MGELSETPVVEEVGNWVYLRSTPHPVTVTTRIITFLVGNPYKPSFATVTGGYTEGIPENYHGSPENRPLEVQRS